MRPRECVLDQLGRTPGLTMPQLVRACGWGRRTRVAVRRLLDQGLITSELQVAAPGEVCYPITYRLTDDSRPGLRSEP